MIKIQTLSFAYEKNIPVLKNISFHANRGETIGLVGANGAGKSTLLKLLVGLELSYQGTIVIDNIALCKKICLLSGRKWAMSFKIPTASFL